MRLKKYILTSLLSLAALMGNAQIFDENVKSLQVRLAGDEFAPPVIVLNTTDRIDISFDCLSEDRQYLRYQLVHCNADWQPSVLVDTEFLDGFNEGTIDNYEYSQLTTTHYIHYTLTIPNEQVAPKVSGNYLLKVYDENDPETALLQCQFMVSEQTASISTKVDTRTDIDFNDKHQQLSIVLDTQHANVIDAYNNITLVVQQNGRTDNQATLSHPLRMNGRDVCVYEHLPQLIFDAGNEYRRFETVSVTYPGMNVEQIAYHDPYYHMKLYDDAQRADQPYQYDQTQNGRYFVREYNSDMSDIEADYIVVHFTLDMPEMTDGMIFLDGDFVQRRFDPESLMSYNNSTGKYHRSMLLKQGSYNYQYLWVPNGTSKGQTAVIEGDKHQTNNEYVIKAYARNPGERFDRLIGVSAAKLF